MPATPYRLDRSVAVIIIDNPPVNGLSHAVRTGLSEALDHAAGNDAVRAVVIAGAGGLFSGGADIREFGTPASTMEPHLRQLVARVEAFPKAVIAAIAGTCLGGGLELAMAAHYRVAGSDARLGLPEIKLGLIPGAGGTQRLPRLAGVERAVEMILGGDPVPAASLVGTRLLDRVVEGDPVAAAVDLAGTLDPAAPLPRARDIAVDRSRLAAVVAEARSRLEQSRPTLPAPFRAVEAIEAAGGPFEEGQAIERRAFLALMETAESKALRHAFFAERAAARVEGIGPETRVRPLEAAAVVGGGTMGAGIAVALLDAGLPTSLLEVDQPALDHGRARIAAIYDAQVQKGKLAPADRDRRLGGLRTTLSYEEIAAADIVIEAVFESLDVKQAVFTELDRVMKPGAILATNTSTLDVDAIARFTRRPADVLGLHFFSPAHVMRLLEVVRARETSAEVLATALQLGKRLRKVPVVSGVCDGFIGNRMLDAYVRQAWWLVEEGASPAQVDRAMERFGMAMGPFRVGDLVGHDVSQAIRRHRRATRPDYRCSSLPDRLCAAGRLGQKTGGGWYDYPDGPRRAVPSPAADELVRAHRAELGMVPRAIDDTEIVDRLVLALAHEGRRLLTEGIAARASDIDVVYVTGYGFPRWRGGPMWYAEQLGWDRVDARIRELGRNPHGDPGFWAGVPPTGRRAHS